MKYFTGLAGRHGHLFGSWLDRMMRGDPFVSGGGQRITPEMARVVERIRSFSAAHEAGSLFLESEVLQLLALQFASLDPPARQNGHALNRSDTERIHEARDYLLANMAAPPGLEALARHAGVNEFKLKRGFKAVFGASPHAYLLAHRLDAVKNLVLDTDLTIAEIAHRVGYSDPAHLTTAFRRKHGVPPSALRRDASAPQG
jgi:AraC family transcriptional regulator, transcriptional activator of the genes for pyochelin and ferripyochelin receptors